MSVESTASRAALGSAHSPSSFSWVIWPGCGTDHSPTTSTRRTYKVGGQLLRRRRDSPWMFTGAMAMLISPDLRRRNLLIQVLKIYEIQSTKKE
jgi:hypothetical protein